MKTVFDDELRKDLIARIGTLSEESLPRWGKMHVGQMIRHCTAWEEMVAGKRKFRRVFLGRLVGKLALRSLIGNDTPLKHGIPTLKELRITDVNVDVEAEKAKWITLIEENARNPNPNFVHPFCGRMTVGQIGRMAYKHTDHHLRQFGA